MRRNGVLENSRLTGSFTRPISSVVVTLRDYPGCLVYRKTGLQRMRRATAREQTVQFALLHGLVQAIKVAQRQVPFTFLEVVTGW